MLNPDRNSEDHEPQADRSLTHCRRRTVTNVAFTVLGTVFNYPDVLKDPVEEILAAFRTRTR